MPNMNDALQEELVRVWEAKRMQAMAAKRTYRDTARMARRYYEGPHDFMFAAHPGSEPTFKVTINKVFEMVQLFGPMTYAQNPQRVVAPKPAGDQMFSRALEGYLNYLPGEYDLKGNSRRSIDECLLNGRGAMFTGIDNATGHVRSVSRDTKDILIDPRAGTWYDGNYMMWLERDVPLWKVAQIYGKATAKKLFDKGASGTALNCSYDWGGPMDDDFSDTDADYKDQVQEYKTFNEEMSKGTAKYVSFVHVYSKMGVGVRESGEGDPQEKIYGDSKVDREYGDNVHLIYEPTSKMILYAGGWPLPFWADPSKKHSWPFSFVDPAENTDAIWPMSLIKPALGVQMFIDWGYSFAMGFVQSSSKSIQITAVPVNDKLELAIKNNQAIQIVPMEIPAGYTVDQIMRAIERPQLNGDLLNMLQAAEQQFEKNTGMNEILYGTTNRSMRSATEAGLKAQHAMTRVDNVIDQVEDWQTQIARKEALGAVWAISGEQMLPIVGEELAVLWDQFRMTRLTDIRQAAAEYTYEIGSGSMRKRTPQARIDTATMMLQQMGPLRLQVGDLPGYNLIEQNFLKAQAIVNTEQYMLATPPVPEGGQEQQPEQQEPPGPPQVLKIENGEPVYGTPTGEVV